MDVTSNPPVVIRPEVLAIPAYTQGGAPVKKGYKLSSNENPFPTLPAVKQAIAEAPVGRYAVAAMPELRAQIGSLFGYNQQDSQNRVHLAAGSVSILYQLIHATVDKDENYIYPWPSFEAYPMLSISGQGKGIRIAGNADGTHDLEAMAGAINDRTRAVLLCTPNNPTGPVITKTQFETFMERVPNNVLVVLDEAYRELVTDPEAVRGEEVLNKYDNLVVLRTFSKAYGLAGLRIGYGVGHPLIWQACRVTAIPLSVSPQAEAAARVSLETEAQEILKRNITELVRRRETLVEGLLDQGYTVPQAQGNYVWLPLGEESQALAVAFAEQGTLVRCFQGEGVRISVGEAESVEEVLKITKAFRQEA